MMNSERKVYSAHELIPYKASPPGNIIKWEIDYRDDLNQKELARQMGVKPSFLNEVIKGKRAVTPDIAILLEESLEISAEFWMRLQSGYEIDKARIKERNKAKIANMKTWRIIQNYIPVKELKKKGFLSDDLQKDIETVFNLYNVKNVEELRLLKESHGGVTLPGKI